MHESDAPMLRINVETNIGEGKLRKTQKLHIRWRGPLVIIFMIYHLVSYLEWQPLQEITKMAITKHRVNIETCNKN